MSAWSVRMCQPVECTCVPPLCMCPPAQCACVPAQDIIMMSARMCACMPCVCACVCVPTSDVPSCKLSLGCACACAVRVQEVAHRILPSTPGPSSRKRLHGSSAAVNSPTQASAGEGMFLPGHEGSNEQCPGGGGGGERGGDRRDAVF